MILRRPGEQAYANPVMDFENVTLAETQAFHLREKGYVDVRVIRRAYSPDGKSIEGFGTVVYQGRPSATP